MEWFWALSEYHGEDGFSGSADRGDISIPLPHRAAPRWRDDGDGESGAGGEGPSVSGSSAPSSRVAMFVRMLSGLQLLRE